MTKRKNFWYGFCISVMLMPWLCSGNAFSQSSSPNYRIIWDVVDEGGGEQDSPNYLLASSIGQTSGIGTLSSPVYTNYVGFQGIPGEDIQVPSTLAAVTPEEGGTVGLPDGSASVTFPEDFFDPANTSIPDEVFVSIVEVEDALIPPPNGGFQLLGDVFELSAFDQDGNPLTGFDEMLALTLSYDPDLVAFKGLIKEYLAIQYYDQVVTGWIPIPSVVDTGQHTVTGYTDHFTLFGIFGAEPVPEPTTGVLVGLGLLSLFALKKRRRKMRK